MAKKIKPVKGIILVTTIFLMGALIAIIAINSEITKKNFDLYNHSKFLHQNNILISNVLSFLEDKASLISNQEVFDALLAQKIDFDDDKSGLKMSITMTSDNDKLNLNNLIKYDKKNKNNETSDLDTKYNQYIYDIISKILYNAKVIDSAYFIDILADSIDKDKNERATFSEISIYDLRFEDGFISSMGHLEAIKDYYIKQNGDLAIKKVDFSKYFKFHKGELDINYMQADTIANMLELDIGDVKAILEKNPKITDLSKVFGAEHNATFNALGISTKARRIICNLDIFVYEKKAKASFRFDFKRKVGGDVKIYY